MDVRITIIFDQSRLTPSMLFHSTWISSLFQCWLLASVMST